MAERTKLRAADVGVDGNGSCENGADEERGHARHECVRNQARTKPFNVAKPGSAVAVPPSSGPVPAAGPGVGVGSNCRTTLKRSATCSLCVPPPA